MPLRIVSVLLCQCAWLLPLGVLAEPMCDPDASYAEDGHMKKEESAAGNFTGPIAPFSPEELWRHLKRLILSYDEYMEKGQVEKVFPITLQHTPYADGIGWYYGHSPQNAWYKSISVKQPGAEVSRFTMSWNALSFPKERSRCLSDLLVRKELEGTQWTFFKEMNSYGFNRDEYRNGLSDLYLFKRRNCIYEVTIMSGHRKED